VLAAFDEGYQRAGVDFARLFELDSLRKLFLALREQAHHGDTEHNADSASAALAAFARVDRDLSLDKKSAEEMAALPQWRELDEELNGLGDLLFKDEIDWKDVREKETHVEQVMRNARYRLHPERYGMRSAPLLAADAPGRAVYEAKLLGFEQRLDTLQASLLRKATVKAPTAGLWPEGGEVTLAEVEVALQAYATTQSEAPPDHPDAAELYRSSAATERYRQFVKSTEGYKTYLEGLHSMEMALQAMAGRLRQSQRIGPPTEAETTLPARIQSEISRRSDFLGLVFLDDIPTVNAANQQRELGELAKLLGEPPGTRPLSDNEKAALDRGELEDQSGRISTITNQLQGVEGVHLPDQADGIVGGVYRVVGDIDTIDLFIFAVPRGGSVHAARMAGPNWI
jgi:hypothetical protein